MELASAAERPRLAKRPLRLVGDGGRVPAFTRALTVAHFSLPDIATRRSGRMRLGIRTFGSNAMQTAQQISSEQLQELVAAIFAQSPVVVRQAYSDFDCATKEFADAAELLADLEYKPGQPVSRQYTLYYPEAKGHTHERRIDLKPRTCKGHTFRFCQEGWGLIQLQCDFRNYPTIECRIVVNSAIRARTWSDTYLDLQSPDGWDWGVIEKKVGRLIRLLRRLGKDRRSSH